MGALSQIELGPLRHCDMGDNGDGKAFSPVPCSCILGMGQVTAYERCLCLCASPENYMVQTEMLQTEMIQTETLHAAELISHPLFCVFVLGKNRGRAEVGFTPSGKSM